MAQLLKAEVCTGSGEAVGQVEDVLLNPVSGRIDYIAVRPGHPNDDLCIRLHWKDFRLDRQRARLVVLPGRSAAQRILLRTGRPEGREALH